MGLCPFLGGLDLSCCCGLELAKNVDDHTGENGIVETIRKEISGRISAACCLDGMVKAVGRGDAAHIMPGMKHGIKTDTELHIIEVQVGDELTEEDIERLEWDWEQA